MELQRCVVRHDRIVREMTGDKVRIDSCICGNGAGRDDGKKAAAHSDESTRRDVLRKQVRARVMAASSGRVGAHEVAPAEDRVSCEEIERTLGLAHMRNNSYR